MTTLADSPEFREFMTKHILSGDSNVVFDCQINQRHLQAVGEKNKRLEQRIMRLAHDLPEPRLKSFRYMLLKGCAAEMRGAPEVGRFVGYSTSWVRYYCIELGIELQDGRKG